MTLKEATTRIKKQFGDEALRKLGDPSISNVEVISTGILSLDLALQVGGLPRGRITQLSGPPGSGKTTIAQLTVAEAQKVGGLCAFIDAEHSLDTDYARALGVDVDNLLVNQPDYGEQGLEIAEALISSNEIDVIVIDSVAALTPKAEIDGEMGDQFMGLQARMMSQAMRKLSKAIHDSKVVAIFLNQVRYKIGIAYGNPEVLPGGEALKFYSGVILDVRRGEFIKDGENVIGATTKVKINKSKVGSPFKTTTFDLYYGKGVPREGSLIDLGVQYGLLEKSGSWLTLAGERYQGRDNAILALRENQELAARLEAEIRGKLA